MNQTSDLQFKVVPEQEYNTFKQDVKEIFSIAVNDTFGHSDKEVITDEAINHSLFNSNAEVYHVYENGEKVAGVVVVIDKETHRNKLDILFVYPNVHSKGLGGKIWTAIENRYPETKVWELVTPYFEKRNIHFYVNKLGFQIVEFFNEYHQDPKFIDSEQPAFQKEFFRFEKVMK